MHRLGAVQSQLAAALSCPDIVHRKIEQVTLAVRDVAAAAAHAVQPLLEGQTSLDSRIGSANAHPAIVDARKIGFAAEPRPKADVQRVIPDAQLPDRWRVDGRDEVDGVGIRYVNDVFVRPNSVERWHRETGHLAVRYLQSPTRMGEADNRSLGFGPLENREIP